MSVASQLCIFLRRHARRLAVLSFALAAFANAASAPVLKAGVFDPPRQAPDFSLQSSAGGDVALGQHRGKIVVLGFGYTSCPDVCPTTLATLAQAHRKLGDAARDVQVIYVTVDPERDTPARLNKYLGSFNSKFLGATGAAQAMAAVRKDYGVQADKKRFGDDYAVAHSSYTYLIDRKGRLRALMPYGRSADDYVHDLSILLQE